MENNGQIAHTISMEQRKKITATAIVEVESFSPQQIVLSYSGGKIVITGSGLKIINFAKSTGAFSAVGEITGIKYGLKNTKLMQKLFK